MEQEKLKKATIDNLAAEYRVSFINYEPKLRGTTQLSCASLAQVKSTTRDLTEKLPSGTFQEYKKKVTGRILEIMDAWATKQTQLLKDVMDQNAVANISLDKRRNGDLNILKSLGGLCTKPEEMEILMSDESIS